MFIQFKYIFPAVRSLKSSSNFYEKPNENWKPTIYTDSEGVFHKAFLIKMIFPFWRSFFWFKWKSI